MTPLQYFSSSHHLDTYKHGKLEQCVEARNERKLSVFITAWKKAACKSDSHLDFTELRKTSSCVSYYA